MKDQNLKNHARIHPPYHYVGTLFVLFTLIGSIINLILALKNNSGTLAAIVILTGAVSILLLFVFVRVYAMQVQDRVIRSEENFRHYLLTNTTLDPRLTMKQIIALRFASDEEFPALCKKAVEKNLKPAEIKKDIHNWKADHHRV